MTRIKMAESASPRREAANAVDPVEGFFAHGKYEVAFEYNAPKERGEVYTGDSLLLDILGASAEFKAMANKIKDISLTDSGLEDVFEDFKVEVEYWDDPSYGAGCNATLHTANTVGVAAAVLQAYVLGVFSMIGIKLYVSDFWGYGADDVSAIVKDIESNPKIADAMEESGCTDADIRNVLLKAVDWKAIEALTAKYDELDGKTKEI